MSKNKVAVVVVKITIRSVSLSSIFWSPSRGHVTKGHAWACILEFRTPRFRRSDPRQLLPSSTHAPKTSPTAQKLASGHPSEGLSRGVQNRNFDLLQRTRVYCAHDHIWSVYRPLTKLAGARLSFEKLVQIPLHVSPNVEFLPLPTPPGKGTP